MPWHYKKGLSVSKSCSESKNQDKWSMVCLANRVFQHCGDHDGQHLLQRATFLPISLFFSLSFLSLPSHSLSLSFSPFTRSLSPLSLALSLSLSFLSLPSLSLSLSLSFSPFTRSLSPLSLSLSGLRDVCSSSG
jgi:hypothetical protein